MAIECNRSFCNNDLPEASQRPIPKGYLRMRPYCCDDCRKCHKDIDSYDRNFWIKNLKDKQDEE